MTQKQVAIDGANVPARPEKLSGYRVPDALMPVWRLVNMPTDIDA